MKTILKSITWLLLLGLLSCEKDNNNTKITLESFDTNKYYSDEIFPSDYEKLYGKWKLYGCSGGFFGGGHELNFDFIELKKYGIYGIIRNDSIIEYGKVNIENQTNGDLLITLESADNSPNVVMHDNEKYINFSGTDSLNLNSPCCDRYNYHFYRY